MKNNYLVAGHCKKMIGKKYCLRPIKEKAQTVSLKEFGKELCWDCIWAEWRKDEKQS